jgi:hypothetical protein
MLQERGERRWSERILKKQEELVQKDGEMGENPVGNNFSANSF